jgi:hypothetical protein
MPICVLRNKSPQQVCDDVDGFAARYAEDWRAWLGAETAARSELFGKFYESGKHVTCAVWIATLEEVAEDIRAFEAAHGSLTKVVPERFAHLAYGRLYDMALGPR